MAFWAAVVGLDFCVGEGVGEEAGLDVPVAGLVAEFRCLIRTWARPLTSVAVEVPGVGAAGPGEGELAGEGEGVEEDAERPGDGDAEEGDEVEAGEGDPAGGAGDFAGAEEAGGLDAAGGFGVGG